MSDDEFGPSADFTALAEVVERSLPAPSRTTSTTPSAPKIVQPTPQALPTRHTPSSLLVSPRQKGNPILTHIQSIPWEYTDTPADYVLGATTCTLFLSLKYHRLHPEYIYTRMRAVGASYNLRILLALVDIDAHEDPLRELAKTSLINNFTLVLAWSAREAARYLEAYKSLEHAAPTLIRGQQSTGYADKMVEFVTVPRGVNKADAVGVVGAFGTVRAAVNADMEEVALVQGWGEVKVKRWCGAVREPFRTGKARAVVGRGDGGSVNAGVSERNESAAKAGMGRKERSAALERRRPQDKVPEWEPGEDDEEALLAAAEDHEATKNIGEEVVPPVPKRARYEEPQLGDGIASALAKYRQG